MLCACALVASLCALTGCKSSLALTELFFDQSAEKIDENNASRLLKNTLTALNLTEMLPELEKNDQAEIERDRTEEEAIQGDEDSKEAAPIATYSETSQSKATNDSQGSSDTTGDSKDEGKDSKTSSSKSGKNKSSKKGKSSSKGKGSKGGQGDGTGKVAKGDGGTGAVYGDDGTYTELPEGVQTAVAFGECANMVLSFAGDNSLIGADAGFMNNSFIKKAYAKTGIKKVSKVSAPKGVVNANAVVKLKPDALLLTNGSYSVSKKGLAKLKKAKIDVVYLPATDSAKHIRVLAQSIGKMFGGASDTLSGKDAQAAAEAYVNWHDEVLESVQANHDELAAPINFETDEEVENPSGNHTLYVSEWDSATYRATPDNALSWTDKNGVAISQVGYKWSPMSYYLSVGGTENVSATFKSTFYITTDKYYVWQFNLGRVSPNISSNWTGTSISVSKLSNSGTADLLVKAKDGSSLGDADFDFVIAKTQGIGKKLETSRDSGTKKQQGLYAAYNNVSGSDKSGTGFLSKAGYYCSAAITGSYDVLVNPCGLYSSWTDGSPESVLEAVWIDDKNNATSNLKTRIKEYYKLFYGVTPSSKQIKAILAGEE